jgi:hypothetical protein
MLDLYSRFVVGWSMQPKLKARHLRNTVEWKASARLRLQRHCRLWQSSARFERASLAYTSCRPNRASATAMTQYI